jgi:voltage-gated potassium channel
VWEQLESGRVRHRFEPVVLAATLALIPVFVIEAEAKSSRWKDIAYAANWLIWLVFAAELAGILVVAPRKAAALRAHWLDAVIVVVTAPAFGAFLSSLRLLRLARLLRLLRLGAILTRLMQRERALTSGTAFRFAALLTLLVIVIAGAAQSLVAHDDFKTTWDGIWWAVETVTTVGYGDAYPTTVQGQIVAMVVMLFGIGFLSVLTAAVASRFVKTERGDETDAILAALARLEAEVAELRKHQVPSPGPRTPLTRGVA